MTDISDFLENALINHILRNVAYTSPANIYLALYTTDPTDADVGVEVAGVAYTRFHITGGTAFIAPVNGVTSNGGNIVFPTAGGLWGTVTHVGIRDNNIGGNLLFHGPLTSPRTVNNGDTFTLPTGNLSVTLS